jgi:tRNA-dihydrouridine synthase A
MEYTDRFFRQLLRLITKDTWLYTEMVVTGAILKGYRERFLEFAPNEHPVALQLGGSNVNDLAECAAIAEDWGYDEVNLNVGCPSDRVQAGRIGACLMMEPELVGQCVEAMQKRVSIPITVKTRIGVDDHDSVDFLHRFIDVVSDHGCETFIVHARKAWLKGLSPKENREIPPLDYQRVYDLKNKYPDLELILNGGVMNLDETKNILQKLDGVMIGRAIYDNPWMLLNADSEIFGRQKVEPITRKEVLRQYIPFVEEEMEKGIRLTLISRHLMGLFTGVRGARQFRRYLGEASTKKTASAKDIVTAMNLILEEV